MAADAPTSPGASASRLPRRQVVFLILLLAVAVRLIGFNAPYIDGHWIKQLQVAPVAKNFYLHGYNLLWPETDYSADQPGYIEIEFQLVTFLTALLYKLFGMHEWVGRLVTVAFSLGTMLLLWRLLARYLGERPAFWGLLFYAFAPSSWYYSRALMSESLMLFFSVAVVYCFGRWLGTTGVSPVVGGDGRDARPTGRAALWFFLTALCGALAFLVKLPTVMLLLPLAYLAWDKWGWGFLRRPAVWALLVLTLGPALVYYWHAQQAIGAHYFTVGVGFGGGMWLAAKDFLRPGNYSLMLQRLLKDHLTAVGMVLLAVGFLLRRSPPRTGETPVPPEGVSAPPLLQEEGAGGEPPRARYEPAPCSGEAPYLFHVWLGVVLLYFVLVSGGNLRQTYYQLPLLLPAAGLIGLAWDRLIQSRVVNRWSNGVLVALFLVLCAWGVQPFFEPYTPILQASAALDRLDPAGKPVIIFPPGYGCLYYFHRPGWVGREAMGRSPAETRPEDLPGSLYVTNRIARGARWAVYFASTGPGGRDDLETYLRTTYRRVLLGEGEAYEVFDLTRPATNPPPCQPVGYRKGVE